MTGEQETERVTHPEDVIEQKLSPGWPVLRHWCALLSLHPLSMKPIDDSYPKPVPDSNRAREFQKCEICKKVVLVEVPKWQVQPDD